jgi:hypothetical protein
MKWVFLSGGSHLFRQTDPLVALAGPSVLPLLRGERAKASNDYIPPHSL